jgi:leucyl aminopeptidase
MIIPRGIRSAELQREFHKQEYIRRVRDAINEPANIATPEYMSLWALELFSNTPGVSVTIMNEQELRKKGHNLVLAVGQGSTNSPRMVVIEYTPAKYTNTICLCGKGVTFDAGGLNIKIQGAMTNMKADKTGGCIALGILKYFADIKFPCRMVAIVPFVENMVSGNSTRPGDIIKSYSGKTVEILDTDAEGRLILADALALCDAYKPDMIIDFATLTGWASSLHCGTSAIYFCTNPKLRALLEITGEELGERVWGMPPWLEYMRYCSSKVADLKNVDFEVNGCRKGSGYMATMFLAHFVPPKVLHNWVHLDICNNVDGQSLNANTMNLIIEVIQKMVLSKKESFFKGGNCSLFKGGKSISGK